MSFAALLAFLPAFGARSPGAETRALIDAQLRLGALEADLEAERRRSAAKTIEIASLNEALMRAEADRADLQALSFAAGAAYQTTIEAAPLRSCVCVSARAALLSGIG